MDGLFGRRRTHEQRPRVLRPGYLAALAGLFALLLAAFAWYEVRAARRTIRSAMEAGAVSLVEAVGRAGENALRADALVAQLAADRLLDNARLLRRLDQQGALSTELLGQVAAENDLYRIRVFGRRGRQVLAVPASLELGEDEPLLQDVWRGQQEEMVGRYGEGEQWLVAAVRRPAGGAIAVAADAALLVGLRRQAGVGRLIQDIGENPGVAYVVLQDQRGILSASRQVEQMPRIAGDGFLEGVLAGNEARSRLADFDGQEVLESAMAFAVDEEANGLLRVGLSTVALQAEERRVGVRLAVLAGLLAVLGVGGVGLVTVRQNYALLDEAYARIRVYSRRILEQMADAVVATDPAGRIQVFNQAAERLFSLTEEQAMGRTCRELLGSDMSALEQSLESSQEAQGRLCRCRMPEGRDLVLSVSTSLIRNHRGDVETGVAVIQDLTERTALEADLRRRERLAAMGELAAGVAHEVRNPLNAIGLIAQRLEREFAPAVDREEYLGLARTVRSEVERVNRIVQQFLRFARPPALVLQEHDLESVVGDAVRVVEPRARQKGLTVTQALGGVGAVALDREQTEQALLNLLNNAVEATDQGGIRVSTRAGVDWVEVEVADTGAGIAADDLERIFDLYYTTKPEGTGLGLSLVQRIAAEHGGRVEVHSAPGRGAAFRLHLPRGGQHGG